MSYSKQVTPLIQSLHTKHSKAGEDITNTENACTNVINKTDFVCNHKCERVPEYPQGIPNTTEEDCCAKCTSLTSCGSWAYATDEPTKRTCYLVTSTTVQGLKFSSSRNVGSKSTLPPPAPGPPTPPPPPGDTFFAHHLLQASGGSGATQWYGCVSTPPCSPHTLHATPPCVSCPLVYHALVVSCAYRTCTFKLDFCFDTGNVIVDREWVE